MRNLGLFLNSWISLPKLKEPFSWATGLAIFKTFSSLSKMITTIAEVALASSLNLQNN